MELIKKTKRKKIGKWYIIFAIFYCKYCKTEVEKQLSNGKKAKSCGCIRVKHNKSKKNYI